MSDPNYLYFDIETTGLSARASHLTVIGTAFYDGGVPVIRQFVCERPTDEKRLLAEFCAYASGFSGITHYNGSSFDLPYLRQKLQFYRLEDPFFDMSFRDLYRTACRFQSFFTSGSLKQKDVEAAFGLQRKDTLSGADCVKAYRDYLRTGEQEPMDLLLNHNREDLLGMLHIEKHLAAFSALAEGRFEIIGIEESFTGSEDPSGDPALLVRIKTAAPFCRALTLSSEEDSENGRIAFSFTADEKYAEFLFPAYSGNLNLYYEHYKDYYYLPLEGRAVHKSVGQFVDPSFRKQATKETAFEPVPGTYYPQITPFVTPAFRRSFDEKISFYRTGDVADTSQLNGILREAFCSLLH